MILTLPCQILMFVSFDPLLFLRACHPGAVENCVALSVCNLPVLVPALAAREEREKFEGTWTGFSFGRQQTTFLSTLNSIQMHIEADQSYEGPFKGRGRQDLIECNCTVGSALPSSERGEYCSACSPQKERAL